MFFKTGHERSVQAKKNIIGLVISKGISIIVSLLLVRLTINYVNASNYGIWITLSSIIAWMSFFDIGFGNGLRNKFAVAKATGNETNARIYISTTYAILSIIFTIVWIIFFGVHFFVNWSYVLNAPREMADNLSTLAIIVFSYFCLQIVLKTINTVLIADQKPARSSYLDMAGQVLTLIIIYTLTRTTKGSLINLGLTLGFAPILVMIISTIWFFRNSYKQYAPSFKYVKFAYAKDIMQLGYRFFIISIASIILYQTSNIIIAHLFGPEQVTPYNIAYKYFGIITMVFGIIIAPFWSAFTEAWTKKDILWIRMIVKKLKYMWIFLTICTILMLTVSDTVYKLWIGNKMAVPFSISIVLSIYVIITVWNTIFSYFINGIGKIQLQLYSAIWCAVINIPLAIILGKNFGISGVIFSTVILSFINSIWITIQYNKVISNNAVGIWNK
ncbi:MAG: polysaccharide biosynthesis C-terminal domain-containing protein [Ignavibacteriaceae bacterium]|nr:polysaccharide biosynthesis C-terminal domain-containing protein [Ignavibacteriaceae bacterium]